MTLPSFRYSGVVTPAQYDFYHTYGFVIYRAMLSPREIEIIERESQDLQAATVRGDIPSDDIDDITPWGHDDDGSPLVHRLPYFTRYCVRTRELIDSKGLDAVGRSLLGESAWRLDDTMHGSVLQTKISSLGSRYDQIQWHIDFPADHRLAPVVTTGIYLDKSTVENGCLILVPGSHLMTPRRADPTWVPVEVEPGDLVCHSDTLYHASTRPTLVGQKRRTLYLYYCAGEYPGPGLPFRESETKDHARRLFLRRDENVSYT